MYSHVDLTPNTDILGLLKTAPLSNVKYSSKLSVGRAPHQRIQKCKVHYKQLHLNSHRTTLTFTVWNKLPMNPESLMSFYHSWNCAADHRCHQQDEATGSRQRNNNRQTRLVCRVIIAAEHEYQSSMQAEHGWITADLRLQGSSRCNW